ncbi:MAG: thiamine-phosphate kinase [Candidatus Saliniplasma sp.]
MKIDELGEFGLIDRLAERIEGKEGLLKGIGDDCAVLEDGDSYTYTLMTTDMLVSGDHFNREWHTPRQIGRKSIVVNVSDIAAMGGFLEWGLVSIAIPDDIEVEYIDEIYSGMLEASEEYGLTIIGGDTTHGELLVINVVIIGKVEKENLCLRGDAEVGDVVCVTGDLGKSWAGLDLLRAGEEGYTEYHLEPKCRLDVGRKLAPYVNAMIDVSDGLASEVNHICRESGVGARIYEDKIPISEKTKGAAKTLDKDPMFWALSGGEDFELVFTIPEDKLSLIEEIDHEEVGGITEKGVYLVDDGKTELKGGYDHFNL